MPTLRDLHAIVWLISICQRRRLGDLVWTGGAAD